MRTPRHEERAPRAAGEASVSRRRWIGIAAGLVVVVLLGAVTVRWRQTQALARVPVPPATGRSEAVAEHLRSRYEEAQRNPASIAAVGPLCLAYHADMFYEQAERCHAFAGELAGEDWRWAYYHLLIQAERGGGDALVEGLRGLTVRTPDFAPVWLRLGDAEFKAARYDQAAEAWRRAASLAEPEAGRASPAHLTEVPLAAHASFGLARLALVRGDPTQAREILERVTTSAPQFGPAFRLLADSYRELGRAADAARAVYRANRLPPYAAYTDPLSDELARESRNSTLLLRVASEANLAVNAAWSEYLTRRALEFDPNNPDVVVKLARILRTVGRNVEALALFERYHQMVPGDYQGLAHIGSCLSMLGRYAEAEAYFQRALTGLDDPLTHYNLGLVYAVTGRLDRAAAQYQQALDRDPMLSDARVNLATALARQGRLDGASRELMRVLESDPENVTALTNLGLVLIQQGAPGRARPYLDEALRLEPRLSVARDALATLDARGRVP